MHGMARRAAQVCVLLVLGVLAGCGGEGEQQAAKGGPATPAKTPDPRVQSAVNKATTDTDGDGILDLYDQDPNGGAADEEAEMEPEPETEPDPNGDYELDCDYILGDYDSDDPMEGYRFVGGGTLTNTGNVGIRVRVTYKWRQLGSSAISAKKTYKLRVGDDREVNTTVPATSDQIDAHQSADGKCSAKATIVDTFGQPES
jgi:hypothetical protein